MRRQLSESAWVTDEASTHTMANKTNIFTFPPYFATATLSVSIPSLWSSDL